MLYPQIALNTAFISLSSDSRQCSGGSSWLHVLQMQILSGQAVTMPIAAHLSHTNAITLQTCIIFINQRDLSLCKHRAIVSLCRWEQGLHFHQGHLTGGNLSMVKKLLCVIIDYKCAISMTLNKIVDMAILGLMMNNPKYPTRVEVTKLL